MSFDLIYFGLQYHFSQTGSKNNLKWIFYELNVDFTQPLVEICQSRLASSLVLKPIQSASVERFGRSQDAAANLNSLLNLLGLIYG